MKHLRIDFLSISFLALSAFSPFRHLLDANFDDVELTKSVIPEQGANGVAPIARADRWRLYGRWDDLVERSESILNQFDSTLPECESSRKNAKTISELLVQARDHHLQMCLPQNKKENTTECLRDFQRAGDADRALEMLERGLGECLGSTIGESRHRPAPLSLSLSSGLVSGFQAESLSGLGTASSTQNKFPYNLWLDAKKTFGGPVPALLALKSNVEQSRGPLLLGLDTSAAIPFEYGDNSGTFSFGFLRKQGAWKSDPDEKQQISQTHLNLDVTWGLANSALGTRYEFRKDDSTLGAYSGYAHDSQLRYILQDTKSSSSGFQGSALFFRSASAALLPSYQALGMSYYLNQNFRGALSDQVLLGIEEHRGGGFARLVPLVKVHLMTPAYSGLLWRLEAPPSWPESRFQMSAGLMLYATPSFWSVARFRKSIDAKIEWSVGPYRVPLRMETGLESELGGSPGPLANRWFLNTDTGLDYAIGEKFLLFSRLGFERSLVDFDSAPATTVWSFPGDQNRRAVSIRVGIQYDL